MTVLRSRFRGVKLFTFSIYFGAFLFSFLCVTHWCQSFVFHWYKHLSLSFILTTVNVLVFVFILQPTPGPVRFIRFKIYDCFREVCVTSLLSLLCDLIVTSNVNSEVAVCMQAEVSYLVKQKQTAAVPLFWRTTCLFRCFVWKEQQSQCKAV